MCEQPFQDRIPQKCPLTPLQGAPPGGKLRVEAALSLRPRHTAVGAVPQPASTVEVQLMGGRPAVALTNTQHVTQEALVTASVDGPGTYALWYVSLHAQSTAVSVSRSGSNYTGLWWFSPQRGREVHSHLHVSPSSGTDVEGGPGRRWHDFNLRLHVVCLQFFEQGRCHDGRHPLFQPQPREVRWTGLCRPPACIALSVCLLTCEFYVQEETHDTV